MLKAEYNSLQLHALKHQLYCLEQQSVSYKIWSAIIRIRKTVGKSLIMKLGPGSLTALNICTYR